MVDLYELKQLAAFADLGTLSRVAEEFHVSTPSVTRSMQHLEQYFGVPLFTRGKNRISLNEAGQLAVTHARKLLEAADQAVAQVRAFDQRQRTIVVKSCAPAPLWVLLRKLNDAQPEKMVSSAICQNAEVLAAWQDGQCDIAVLPFPIDGADINGFNFLLRTELGFWDTLCREKMPASKFLVQTDSSVFDELVRASSLPCFTTDYGRLQGGYPGRVHIPLTDTEAHVTFYLAAGKGLRL